MAINSLSTGFRPGVCTSGTRPTAPYEGQVIYETDTDLSYVWGGAAWQQVSGGTAVGNSGLVYVKSQTIGAGVSSVSITDAFSATYDNYVVTVADIDCVSTAPSFRLTFGGVAGSAYYGSMYFDKYNGLDTGTERSNAGAFLRAGFGGDSNEGTITMTIFNPFATKRTAFTSQFYGGGYSGWASGILYTNDSYTSFAIALSSSTMTGGVITVYGYRK